MRCPFCRHSDCRVIDSREVDDGQATRRRRSCAECGRRFTTVEEAVLAVVKRSGVTEPFSRDKVVSGVRRACQGRPVDEDASGSWRTGSRRRSGPAARPRYSSHEVGLAISAVPLLDEVAHLRFASVYRSFSSIEDFEKEIADLRRPSGGGAPPVSWNCPSHPQRHPTRTSPATGVSASPARRHSQERESMTETVGTTASGRKKRTPRRRPPRQPGNPPG